LYVYIGAIHALYVLLFFLPTGSDETNAQASDSSSGGAGGEAGGNNLVHLVNRRYVPRFVGKRDQEPTNTYSDNSQDSSNAQDSDSDLENALLEYFNTLDDTEKDNFVKEMHEAVDSAFYDDIYGEEGHDEYDADFTDEEEQTPESGDSDVSQETDKRSRTYYGGRQYNPMFVGKRYRPMFVGKRYRPMFVGKKYRPMFVGKRYRPMFVGKRYRPMFVGKRYRPMFVGKRYIPQFVGKRYIPQFVGKRYIPQFVGKRYIPQFVGKRYTPKFVGKRDTSGVIQKSVSHVEGTEILSRKKRSVDDLTEEMERRAWGSYFPWTKVQFTQPTMGKRFVAPEFIGRRDSLTSILSALDALEMARDPARSTNKRFEAPLFVGKRTYRPMFVGKRSSFIDEFVPSEGLPYDESGLNSYEYIPSQYPISQTDESPQLTRSNFPSFE